MGGQTSISMGGVPAWHAARKPTAAAVVLDGETLDWQTLAGNSASRAAGLTALGVGTGDVIVLVLHNSLPMIENFFAIWLIGATPLPLSPSLSPLERAALIDLAKPALVIGDGIDAGAWRTLPAQWTPDATTPAFEAAAPAANWKIMASGGSTGRPKLIVTTRPAVTNPATYELFPWDLHQGRLGEPNGVMICPGPLHHNGPLVHAMLNLFSGSTLVLMSRFDAAEFLGLVERHAVRFAYLVPTMMHRIRQLPSDVRNAFDISSLKGVIHTAAMCPPELKRFWIDWLGADRVWETYGSTEAAASALISGGEWLTHPGSVGRFYYGSKGEARNPDGQSLEPGEIGDIWVKPGDLGAGFSYIGGTPDEKGGWYWFGDVGSIDQSGYIFLADRRSDLIIRGGINIYPAEVEAALESHPGVVAAAVVGLPDADMGARVHAIVQANRRLCQDELTSHLAERLAPYKQPRSFEFVSGNLRDASGKIRRSALRLERIEQLGTSQ